MTNFAFLLTSIVLVVYSNLVVKARAGVHAHGGADASVLRYLADIATGREARYLGHNPAGGVMIFALLVTMFSTALTGWLMTTDAFWGVDWVGRLHERIADLLLILVLAHLAGVALASVRHRENLVAAMLSGRKRTAEPGDVT